MPEVQLPSDFVVDDTASVWAGGGVPSLSGGPYDLDRADIYVGLVFDGFRHYHNLTAVMPGIRFEFFPLPTIDVSTRVVIYQPHYFGDIHITVSVSFLPRDAMHPRY